MLADVSALVNAIASHVGNGDVTFIAAVGQAVTLSMRTYNCPYTILTSAALPAGTVIAVVNRAVVSAMESPRITASQEAATLHFEDTTPTDISTAGAPPVMAYPVKWLYQIDSVAMKLIQPISYALRDAGALAWIQGATW